MLAMAEELLMILRDHMRQEVDKKKKTRAITPDLPTRK
jgi:hypothetical protein